MKSCSEHCAADGERASGSGAGNTSGAGNSSGAGNNSGGGGSGGGGTCTTPPCTSAEAPSIDQVAGNGTEPALIANGLFITGERLASATFTLTGESASVGLDVISQGETEAHVALPADVLSGEYTLTAVNASGEDAAAVVLTLPELTGEQLIDRVNEASSGTIDAARLPTTLASLGCGDDETAVKRAGAWTCEAAAPTPVFFVATSDGYESIASTSPTALGIDAVAQSRSDFAAGTFEAPVDGVYRFSGHVTSSFHGNTINFLVLVNGANDGVILETAATVRAQVFVFARVLNAGDTVQLAADSYDQVSYRVCDSAGCLWMGELVSPL